MYSPIFQILDKNRAPLIGERVRGVINVNSNNNILIKLKMNSYTFIKRFRSKRNRVYLVRNPAITRQKRNCVLKVFSNPGDLVKEAAFLEILKQQGVRVPRVLHRGSNYLLLEYIDGENLADFVEQMEKKGVPPEDVYPIADSLCKWLKSFYRAAQEALHKRIIMKDVNLRNYIVRDGKIYGIDFEEAGEGSPEEDFGKICAFLLTYRPEYTLLKLELVRYIFGTAVKKLKLNPDLIMNELVKELLAIKRRRKGSN